MWSFHRVGLRQKISLGYAIAVGVAVIGSSTGHIIGEHHAKQAFYTVALAQEEGALLSDLALAALMARSHEQQLISLLTDLKKFEQTHHDFLQHIETVITLLEKVKTYTAKNKNNDADIGILEAWLQKHDGIIESYVEQIEASLRPLDLRNPQSQAIAATYQALLTSTNSQTARQFDDFSDDLQELIVEAREEAAEAQILVKQADRLEFWIINLSLMLSVSTAIALALWVSRTISRPIEAVTQVAHRVALDADFSLEAPVLTQDEVGILAKSFNSLIHKVADYTHALELNHQTLEQRVTDRTQELRQALDNLQQTQTQLIQSEKMSSLGQMVAGVAHEINNPVNFIHGNLSHIEEYSQNLLTLVQVYQDRYPHVDPDLAEQLENLDFEFLSQDLPKLLSSIKMGTERIRQIVLSLRNFSRLDESELKLVDLHEGLESTLLILNHRFKKGIILNKEYGELPLVQCYPAQLNQVFMNILNNAADALDSEPQNTQKCVQIQTQQVNDQIIVRIRDNGPGIPAAIQAQVFNPFFTTKPVGQGTGLGLSICYQIIEKHQGKVEIVSQPDWGTEFVITLPIQVMAAEKVGLAV